MTTDRELLESAARAAGYTGQWTREWWAMADGENHWDPLRHNGQALRLGVALGLEIYHSINNDRWTVFVGYPKGQRIVYAMEEYGDDELAATRRAIVRAAAEIGKDLK